MKKLLLLFIVIFIYGTLYAQISMIEYNYANGNGTILRQYFENGYEITLRKHEDRFSICPYGEIIAFAQPFIDSDKLFSLKDGDYVNTMQVANLKNISTGNISNWVLIRDENNRIGWLDMNTQTDSYRNGIWSIVEKMNFNGRNWTVRKMEGGVNIYETLNVRNNPGIIGTNILFQFIPTQRANKYINVTILAITEETDTIDGITDFWLYVRDDENRTGWIFGGYTNVERGGPKYRNPNSQIRFYFNLP